MGKANKESFFNVSWGKDSAFSKNVERAAYETNAAAQEIPHPVAEQILNLHKVGSEGDTRVRWMTNLAKDALSFIADQRGIRLRAVEEESLRYQSTRSLIEEMFELLQVYALDFNQSAAWTSLQVTCTKPAFVTEVLRYNKLREPVETITTFRCRLSTRFLSLVIVGRKECIEFRLLPVDEVIGLSRAEAAYEPFLVIDSYFRGGDISWTVCDEPLSGESLEDLCMDLFSILVEQTKDEATKNQTI